MPISFPANPSVGQLSVQSGRTYSWSGYAWELTPAALGTSTVEYATTTSFPAPGVTGIVYVATDTGRMYRWTGSEYVESGATPTTVSATDPTAGLTIFHPFLLGGM
jgi:hypothetical protein